MKLTIEQAVEKLAAAWGPSASIVPYRVCGNRYEYAATDHGEHWMPLETSWVDGRQVFETPTGWWPERQPKTWMDAVLEAQQLAMAYFLRQGNKAALRRLPKAMVIADAQEWKELGDKQDTWLMPSSSNPEMHYRVNRRCTCSDYQRVRVSNGWCKHRLARALAKRAALILQDENRALAAVNTDAPSTTASENGRPRRIDVVVGYKADDARTLPRINGNGQLISFKADGRGTEPPTCNVAQLYRWLQEYGYVPTNFKWLGWEQGLRHRLQTYLLEVSE